MKWQLYFYKEICKVFFFFLIGFFILFSMMEYAAHMNDFYKNSSVNGLSVVVYYLNQFLKRLDFLIPMALLLTTIKVLTTLNMRNEWTVFQVAGLSTRKLLKPFFITSLLCTLFLWTNFEFLLPNALQKIEEFRISNFHGTHSSRRKELIHLIPLKDGSKLIYQGYLPDSHLLFDVLWIKNGNEIWRMKYLSADPKTPEAHFVDHLARSSTGVLEKKESFETLTLPDLKWHPKMARKGLVPFDQKKISELFRLSKNPKAAPYEKPRIKTALFFKTIMPLLAPLIIVGCAPVCLTFSRFRSLFFIYAIGLFSLFALYMLIDSLTILSDHALVSPLFAIVIPLILLTSFFGWRYAVKTS